MARQWFSSLRLCRLTEAVAVLGTLLAAALPLRNEAGELRAGAAERPRQANLGEEQLRQLRQAREQQYQRASRFKQEGKWSEAVEAAKRLLEVEQQLFGDPHDEVIATLGWLASMHEESGDFPAAEVRRKQALERAVQLHGPMHWRVTDARLDLQHTQTVAALAPDQRARLARAHQLALQAQRWGGKGSTPRS